MNADTLTAAVVPVCAALATGLPVMFGALRQIAPMLDTFRRATDALERIADRLENARYLELTDPPAPPARVRR